MKKILILMFVGLLLSGISSCQTNEPDFDTKIQLAAANMKALPGHNDGSIAHSVIIAEGPNYALIQNMGWLHQPNQHEPVPNSEVEQAITKTFAQNSVRPMKFDNDMGTKSITNVSAETCQNLLPEL